MGDRLRLTGEGSADSLHSSAPALLEALRTRHSIDAALYLNQARATYRRLLSEMDVALPLLHPPDEDLEVGKVTIFLESAGETPTRPRQTNLVYNGTKPTPLYAVVCQAFTRDQTRCPALPPASHAPRGWAQPRLSPPLSRTRGTHQRGQSLWQERPGTPLLLPVITTRGDPERVLEVTPTHLCGAAPVPRLPLPAPEARDGMHAFLLTQEVTAITRSAPCAAPPGTTRKPPRAQGTEPHPGLGAVARRVGQVARLPPAPVSVERPEPPPQPATPPPPGTAQHCPRHATDALGGSGTGTPSAADAYQDNSDAGH